MIDKNVIKEIISVGNEICIPVKGKSMMPFLKDFSDFVYLKKPEFPLKNGDIAFFEDEYNRMIMHRVCRITNEGYYFRGDAMRSVEGPVSEKNIFAVVTKVQKNGKIIRANSLYVKIYLSLIGIKNSF